MAPPLPLSHLFPPLVLALAGLARASFTVLSWPRVAVVTFGGSATINCSRSACPGDNATLTVATSLPATPGPGGLLWQSFRIRNVSRWEPGDVTCSGRCGDTEATASTAVIVYQLPQKVSLDPVPAVAVGDSRNLTCHVLEVAPLANLTVTLRRGTETLRTQSFGDSDGSASVAVSHLLTATRGDHGQDVTCHAELSLRPHGPLFARAATPVTLSVFALPDPPLLLAPSLLEVATSANATCHLSGAFPVGDIRVTFALDGQPLNATTVATGDTVTASAQLSPLPPGQHELTCTAQVATVAKSATKPLRVYRFPDLSLQLSPAPAVAGREVTVACDVGDSRDTAELQLRDGAGRALARGRQGRAWLRVVAASRDNGREFRCRASLRVGDTVVTKEAEARLEVLYPPEFPPGSCPRTRTWLRGSREFLSCQATGNPSPTLRCARHGATVATSQPLVATKSRAGTYECRATNALGTRSRRVTVRVEYEPTLSESGCPERQVWVEGQRWHLRCHSDGDPAPRTRCDRRGGTGRGGTHGDTHGDTHGGIQDGGIQDGGTHGGTHGDTHGGIQDGGTQDGGTQYSGARDDGIQDGGIHGDTRDGGIQDGGTHGDTHGGIQDGGIHGDTRDGGIQDGGTQYSGTQDGGIQDGGTHGGTHSDTQDGGIQDGGTHGDTHGGIHGDIHDDIHGRIQDGGIQDGGTHGGIQDGGTHGGIQDGGTHGGIQDGGTHGGIQDGGSQDGIQDGGTHGGIQDGGSQDGRTHDDTQDGGTQDGSTHGDTHGGTYGDTHGGTQDGSIQDGGTHGDTGRGGTVVTPSPGRRVVTRADGDTRDRDTGHGATHDGDTHDGGTHGDTHGGTVVTPGPGRVVTRADGGTRGDTGHGGTRGDIHGGTVVTPSPGRVVTRADGGIYVCRATNRHGVAERSVLVTVEYPPSLPERGCPARRRWLQGAPGELGCEATGNPRPRVSCARIGDYRDDRDDYRDYRDDNGHYRDDHGNYRDDHSQYRDNRDDDGHYRDDNGHYRDDHGNYRDDDGHYRDDNGHYRDAHGNYRDDHGRYRDNHGRYHDDSDQYRDYRDGDSRYRDDHDNDGQYRDDHGDYRDDRGRYRNYRDDDSHYRDNGRQYRDDHSQYRDDHGRYRDNHDGDGQYRDDDGNYRNNHSHYRDDSGRYHDDSGHYRDYRDMANGSRVTANVTRGHAGVYECRASNEHGWASKNISVAVEYPPSAVTVRVLPSPHVGAGRDMTLHCSARGLPAPTLSWALPPAPNLRWARDNRSVAIVGATAANRGRYTCTARNRHGRGAASAELSVGESWLLFLVALGALGGGSVLASLVAGGFYLKTRACKKGEYNVRDAEGASEATRLHQNSPGDIFGIQLTQT